MLKFEKLKSVLKAEKVCLNFREYETLCLKLRKCAKSLKKCQKVKKYENVCQKFKKIYVKVG